MKVFFDGFALFAIAYVAAISATYLVFTAVAARRIYRYLQTRDKERLEQLFRSKLVPPITIVCPAYNEVASIVDSVRSLLRMKYSLYEVVVVNDGSKDGTLVALIDAFALEPVDVDYEAAVATRPVRGVYASHRYPKLTVVDKENGGKADALNAGLNASKFPLFCAVDADAVLEEDALLHLVVPMIDTPVFVPVSGGIVRAANGCRIVSGGVEEIALPRNPIEIFQIIEYLRAFLCGRTGQAGLNVMLIVSGAFGLFHKATVKAVGGYHTATVGEDFELVVRIARYLGDRGIRHQVSFVPQTVCWTEVPTTMRLLARQRNRWHRGMCETIVRHAAMCLNPRYGRSGMIGVPYFVFIEMLGPVVEVAGLLLLPPAALLGMVSVGHALLFLLCAVGLGVILSVSALVLEEVSFHRYGRWRDVWTLFGYALLENFGYRQLTLLWRIAGTIDWLRGKHAWGEQVRVGFKERSQN